MKIPKPVEERFPISSPYGTRLDPITRKETEFHNGIDFAVPVGTPIRTCFDGIIERIGYENEADHAQGFGLRVWQSFTQSGVKYGMVFAHLSQIKVEEKVSIKAGDVLGLSGNTGKSTGPHLHVGVRTWDTSNWVEVEV